MTESFDHKEFCLQVNEELQFLGISIAKLSKNVSISKQRLAVGLRGELKFKPDEVKAIEKVLGMD